MRRLGRCIFTVAVAAVCLIAIALALELFARIGEQVIVKKGQQWQFPLRNQQKDACAVVVKQFTGQPPEALLNDIPKREAFEEFDDAARHVLATRRRELVMQCTPDAHIEAMYAGAQREDMVRLAELIKSKGCLTTDIFKSVDPFQETIPPRDRIAKVLQEHFPFQCDYKAAFPDGTTELYDIFFMPLKKSAGAAVFVGNPIWEERWLKFRKNVRLELASGEGVWESDTVRFNTNNFGFRGADVAVPKPPDVFRIACVGGSTTIEGLTDELTYPYMLEKKLRDYFETDKIEVVNCGVYGVVSSQERKRLPDYLALQPDLIVYYNFINDVRQALPDLMKIEGNAGDNYKRIQQFLRGSKFLFYAINPWLLPSRTAITQRFERDTFANLDFMREQAKAQNAGMAICTFACPDMPHLGLKDRWFFEMVRMPWFEFATMRSYCGLVDTFNSMVQDFCKKDGMICVPVAENLKGGTNYFTDVCHMNPAGIERKAQIVFEALKDHVGNRMKKF